MKLILHSSYGEELVITSDDEIDDSLSCKSTIVGADLADSPNIIAVCRQSDGSKSIVIDSSKVSYLSVFTILFLVSCSYINVCVGYKLLIDLIDQF